MQDLYPCTKPSSEYYEDVNHYYYKLEIELPSVGESRANTF